jgi:histidinol-phosphate aminotransferase
VDDRELKPRGAVVKMAPYSPPSAGRAGKLRLDFNENTVGCSPAVVRALVQAITQERLTIYPEYEATRRVLSEFFALPESQFLLTNGTDEAIQVLVNTYVDDDQEAIILTPSYAMYRFYAEVAGANVRNLPYRAGSLAFPLEELLAAITPATRAILLSNPNNPTGTGIDLPTIETILQRAPHAAVLIDEAYYEFCGVTALPLIERYRNLFVGRTFSKAYGLAGLRIGCLFSQAENVKFLHKAQSPYSVNILAAIAARAGVADPGYVSEFVRQSVAARDLLYAGFEKRGIPFYKSQGNFVLFDVGAASIGIRDGLRERGVLVRDRSYEIEGCVRVTAGTPAQVERFFAALDEVRA